MQKRLLLSLRISARVIDPRFFIAYNPSSILKVTVTGKEASYVESKVYFRVFVDRIFCRIGLSF